MVIIDRPSRGAVVATGLALALATGALYTNALEGPFTFDSVHVVRDNPSIRDLGNIPSFFVDKRLFSVMSTVQNYRPIYLTSMALCWWAGDGSPRPFHVVSVLIHALNAVLAFALLLAITPLAPAGTGPATARGVLWVSAVGAALFAVHPLATESVDYVMGQSVLMAAAFYLLAMNLVVRAATSPRPRRWIAGASAAYALGLLSKAIAFTFPLNLALFELLLRPTRAGDQPEQTPGWRGWVHRAARYWPFLALTAAYFAMRTFAFGEPLSKNVGLRSYGTHYLTQVAASVFYYLKLSLWPWPLSVDRDFALATSFADLRVLAALVVLALIAGLLAKFRRHRLYLFWAGWAVACIVLTTFGLRLVQIVNEHRAYLSLLGVAAIAALLLRRARDHLAWSSAGSRRARAIDALAVTLVIALGGVTRARNEQWSSELALWGAAARAGGTWRAHMYHGQALDAADRPDEAIAAFERAVELGRYAFAHVNLGAAYVRRGRVPDALPHLRTAVELWPTLPDARLYLGWALRKSGDLAGAAVEVERAIELRPRYILALEELALVRQALGQVSEERAALRKILAMAPEHATSLARLKALESAAVDLQPPKSP